MRCTCVCWFGSVEFQSLIIIPIHTPAIVAYEKEYYSILVNIVGERKV
jgi:hypothetical protein